LSFTIFKKINKDIKMSIAERMEEKINGICEEFRENYSWHLKFFVKAIFQSEGDFNDAALLADEKGVNPSVGGWITEVWYDAVEVCKHAIYVPTRPEDEDGFYDDCDE
jgi:hypothetical protein